MRTTMHRREFLKCAAAAGATVTGFPYIIPRCVLGGQGTVPPSEKIAMACIGVGSMGGGHLRSFTGQDDVRMVAACDLRRKFRERAKQVVDQKYGDSGCQTYNDYRELLARPDLDAVLIAVPDHWHALIAMEAARNRKDMYLEKPIDVHVAAANALRETVNRYGIVFQFGTQQRSDQGFRFGCELVRNGRIGKLHTIVVGSLPGMELANQPLQPEPDPEEFDYNFWLGPAPWTPYTFERSASRAEGSPGYWMHIHDYGLGCLSGAWGIHDVDIAQWGNNSDDTGPLEIEGTGVIPPDGLCDTALTWRVEHTYANGVKMIYLDRARAQREFPQFESKTLQYPGVGALFIGSDGWVIVSRGGGDAGPKSLLQTAFDSSEPRLPVSNNHRRNFLDCVKTRRQPISHIESAVRSDTICHLADIAIRTGHKLRWDPKAEQFIGDPEANRLLTRPLRSPWRL